MKVVITGGAGFIGSKLARALLGRDDVERLVLFDVAPPAAPPDDDRVELRTGDIAEPVDVAAALGPDASLVFHLAAVVSGQAEAEFDLGLRVNLDGTRTLLEACRGLAAPPRVVFTSSVAAFGGALPEVLSDATPTNPQTSYGNQKVIGEHLVKDYSRKGFIDGRALRLPTIVVRPGAPNLAASGFASSIVREPLMGRDYICPVAPEVRMWSLSPRRAVAALLHAAELPAEAWGVDRVLNLPGLTVSMAETVAAMRRLAGDAPLKRLGWQTDDTIMGFVEGWPASFETPRALAMGFEPDAGIDEIVAAFIEDELDGQVHA